MRVSPRLGKVEMGQKSSFPTFRALVRFHLGKDMP
jgi:hypothetical protein